MTEELYVVPTDPDTPYPVRMERVIAALKDLGMAPRENADGSLLLDVDGVPVTVSQDSAHRFISMHTTWGPRVPYADAAASLFALTDAWNRERYFPTTYLTKDTNGNVEIVLDYVIDCQSGLSDNQLLTAIRIGFETGPEALFFIQDSASQILNIPDQEPILPQ